MATDKVGPPRPDLQELVKRFGTYSAITAQAWGEYDRDVKVWQDYIRSGQAYYDRARLREAPMLGRRVVPDAGPLLPARMPRPREDNEPRSGEPRITGIPELEETR